MTGGGMKKKQSGGKGRVLKKEWIVWKSRKVNKKHRRGWC